jgi:signal transduction histidine kinase
LARRLTIRKKLFASLALVLGISAVLTVNTLIGLYSYRDSVRGFDAKTDELPLGGELWKSVAQLDQPTSAGTYYPPIGAGDDFTERLTRVEEALADYRSRLNRTLLRGRDPDDGRMELKLLEKIDRQLKELLELPPDRYWDDDPAWPLDPELRRESAANRQRFREGVASLSSLVGSLSEPTSRDMIALAKEARSRYTTNLWIAWFTGVFVTILLLVLGRLSYKWIFRPIRQLHSSVQRVGQGDLTHRIELNTGDEMQELAEEFNRMTARLQAYTQDLKRQVEERSRQLVRSEQLASVGFLAAGVAHEINNPLASISLGAEALERRLRASLAPDAKKHDDVWRCVAMIQSEAFRCKGITEKLLDFSRLRDHERVPSSLPDLVAEVIDIVQHMGRYREKQIVLASPSDVVVPVNPPEIKQVVLNLVVNALESMNARGTLSIDVREAAGAAELVFTDDGCGMTPDVLANIFEPFFTRSRSGKGTGLGLSIAHRIISDHGGQIEAQSDGPGAGSRFTVRLPLSDVRVKEDRFREPIAA